MPVEEVDERPRVLLVEDDRELSQLYLAYLGELELDARHAQTVAEAKAALAAKPPEVVLLDLMLPDGHGHEVLREVRASALDTAVIVITATGSISVAVESMRAGAYDFLVKPFSLERLHVTLGNALELRRLKRLERNLSDAPASGFEAFIGASPVMLPVYRTIRDAAPSKAPVFLTGESGTGKELAAQAIHRRSPRANGPFVALNCSAIPRELVESELFGHVKGAFTGAVSRREGIARRADGGTLFLDEIGEMDLPLQAKLLRLIETGSYTAVGGDEPRTADLRFVSATNGDPLSEIRNGRFREDLYYRLNVVPIHLPPLRERGSDIILIARHFLAVFAREERKRFDGFDPEAERLLLSCAWPGNVRQLLNVVRNIVVLSPGGVVTPAMLPPSVRTAQPNGFAPSRTAALPRAARASAAPDAVRPLAAVERQAIEAALEACAGNVPRAAALLEVDPSTIYRKKREWARAQKLI